MVEIPIPGRRIGISLAWSSLARLGQDCIVQLLQTRNYYYPMIASAPPCGPGDRTEASILTSARHAVGPSQSSAGATLSRTRDDYCWGSSV